MKPTLLPTSQVATGEHGEGAKVLHLVPKKPEPAGSNTSVLELLDDIRTEVLDPANNITKMVICYVTADGGLDTYWCQVAQCSTLETIGLLHASASDYMCRSREGAEE